MVVLLNGEASNASNETQITVPARLQVSVDEKILRIRYYWFRWNYLPTLLFWLFIILIIAQVMLTAAARGVFYLPLGILITVIGGFGWMYWSMAHVINRTYCEVTIDEISVWFDPLPWFGEITMKTAELERLLVHKTPVTRQRTINPTAHGKTMWYEHHLYGFGKDSAQEFLLLPYLPSREAAFFCKQQIEHWLSSNQNAQN